jgi:adenine phosphoribosyltransferase
MYLKEKIRSIPDFPKPGVVFRDITTLIADSDAFKYCINKFVKHYRELEVTKIAAIESRGFIFGGVVALKLGVGLVPIRKKGKLPWDTVSEEYQLEYGTDAIEIHSDAVGEYDRVVIIDDLLATGGTAAAAARLIRKLQAEVVGLGFVIELSFLNGRDNLQGYDIFSLVDYESEQDEESDSSDADDDDNESDDE